MSDMITVNGKRLEDAHNLVSQMLIAMLQAKSMGMELSPLWFTEKARDACQAMSECKGEDQMAGLKAKLDEQKPETAIAVMSGRTSEGIWEVLSYWASREQADKAHDLTAKMEV